MIATKTLIRATAALAFGVLALQTAAAGANDPGRAFVEQLAGEAAPSTVDGVRAGGAAQSGRGIDPSAYIGEYKTDAGAQRRGIFVRTEGQGFAERAGLGGANGSRAE